MTEPTAPIARFLRFKRYCLAAFAFAFVSPTLALAEPSAADKETARVLYKEANALRGKGDYVAALERYKAAHALGQTPKTGLALGQALEQVGQLMEAREVLLAVERIPTAPHESSGATEARAESKRLAEQLETRIATLTVEAQGVPEGSVLDVWIDDVQLPEQASRLPRRCNPGRHSVAVARRNGSSSTRTNVTLNEGETKVVTLSVPAESPPVAPASSTAATNAAPTTSPSPPLPSPPQAPPKPTEQDTAPRGFAVAAATGSAYSAPTQQKSSGRSPVLSGILISLGAAGVATGGITYYLTRAKKETVDAHCSSDKACDQAGMDAVSAGKTLQSVSIASLVVGGASLVGAAVYFLRTGSKAETETARVTSVHATAQSNAIGVWARGTF